MGWFQFGRSEGFPTIYKEQHTAARIDVLTTGLILCLVVLAISLFSILPAYGPQKRRSLFLRIVVSLFIGGVVLVCNFGHNWEIGTVKVITPYKPSTHEEIVGTIGLHVTLRGINITMTGYPLKHGNETSSLEHEIIDYNEHFSWEWAQGRFGFGKYAGQFSKDFRAASERGVPLPILQIAEYFTFDGEGIRFGRYYRLAGWYSHLLMWSALGTWFISNILFCMIVSSAVYFLIITGILQLFAIGIWTFLRNPIEIQIPFAKADKPHDDILLKTSFGPDYYLVLGNGLFCILLGFLLLILNSFIPDAMCKFFCIDPITIYDELLLSKDELKSAKQSAEKEGDKGNLVELKMISMKPDTGSGENYATMFQRDPDPSQSDLEGTLVLKRRTNVGSGLFQKSFRKPKPKPRTDGGKKFSDLLAADDKDVLPYYFSKAVKSEDQEVQMPLLNRQGRKGCGSEDESDHISWPPPPRESALNKPPTPPPKWKK